MASIFDGIDMSDPCAVWPKLQEVAYRMMAGENVAAVQFRDREVRFNRSDLGVIEQQIAKLQSECEAKQGRPRKRFAIRAGFRQR